MITLSNGHKIQYVVASGALGFTGRGWFWERPLVWFGLIKPELFTVVLKSLTRYPRKGNLCWWKPWTWLPFSAWSCVRFLPGGAVNKVGLTNPGINSFCGKIAPKIDFKKYNFVASIFGEYKDLVQMAILLNQLPHLVALEVNVSCPNTGHGLEEAQQVIGSVKMVKRVSRHPIIVKLSVDQNYLTIAYELRGIAEAISLNSVPWKTAFPNGETTPLWELEKKVGGGGGGVSGKPAQKDNWRAMETIAKQGAVPVIAPSIMEYDDLARVENLGAKAFAFGAIHLRTPWKATEIVQEDILRRSFKDVRSVTNESVVGK